jgi:hypothetical protein
VDCRKLNDVTRKDCFPLPRIDDTLNMLAGAKYFSTYELKKSHWAKWKSVAVRSGTIEGHWESADGQ